MSTWLLYVILTIPGSGFMTTDKIEGFHDRAQCERAGALLYSMRDVSVRHVCLEIK